LRAVRCPARGACLLLAAMISCSAAVAQQPGPEANAPPPEPPASQMLIYQGEATSILGRQVTGPDAKTVGRIVDVLVDDLGQPSAVVVDVGGFLGIGVRRIAVVWRALRFMRDPAGEGQILLEMTANQIKATPEYKAADRPVVVAVPPRTERALPRTEQAPP
jgi:hypothetical protein